MQGAMRLHRKTIGCASWGTCRQQMVSTVWLAHGRGRQLLIRSGSMWKQGQWALPGGFVDEHEPLDEAAARELQEETSVDPKSITLVQVPAHTACRFKRTAQQPWALQDVVDDACRKLQGFCSLLQHATACLDRSEKLSAYLPPPACRLAHLAILGETPGAGPLHVHMQHLCHPLHWASKLRRVHAWPETIVISCHACWPPLKT